jgi:uroporphyrinogen decarboxylase
MSSLKNDRFIKALLREPIDRTPVWLMRQAGRYLPEYRALRSQVKNFFEFCRNPALACEVTIQPIDRFALDAAIIFSDILTVPIAMGCDITMDEGRGPVAPNPIRDKKSIDALNTVDAIEKLTYVSEAIQLTKRALNNRVPLIGFAGSPWTVATYMVEGQSSKTFEKIKAMLFREPNLLHLLLEKLTDVTIEYLNAQIQAGADVIMVFDSWGGVLSPRDYQHFSLNYMKKISERVLREYNSKKIPLIFFSKGCGLYLDAIADGGCDAVGLDWTMDLAVAKKQVGQRVALQGNLDPSTLFASADRIQHDVRSILDVYHGETGFIFNLGHGISKDTPVEGVAALVDAVVNYK